MSETMGATRRLGRFVADCARGPIAAPVMEKAAICLLDGLGLALIARDEPTGAAMRAIATPATGPSTARIWADGTRTSVAEAVAANAVAVHAHFHDDTDYASWTHPGSLIVSAAVGIGEATGAPVERVLRGIVAGYDALAWLGAGERVALALIGRGIRTSPTLGTIGAAATAAAVLGLDEAAAANAIGIASSMTGGVPEPVRTGSDEWRVQNAHAARGGVLAAQLAGRGVKGAPTGLEGPKGFARSLAGLDAVPEWDAAPASDAILAVVAKPWATLGDNMAAAAAARLLYEDGVDVERIRSIRVRIWRHYAEYPGTNYRGPFERTAQALASTVFATAAMLVCGELEFDVPQNRREDAAILRLAAMTSVEPDDEGGPADGLVELTLDDGSRRLRTSAEAPRTLLYHDRPTATALFGDRLVRSGDARGRGPALAADVFAAAEGGGASIAALLDGIVA